MKKIVTYIVLALAALITLAPVIWTILSSMRPPAESLSVDGSFIPSSLDFSSYPAVFKEVDMWMLTLNSVLVTESSPSGRCSPPPWRATCSRDSNSGARTSCSPSSWRP